MTLVTYQIAIDRLIVHGADVAALDTVALRQAIEIAVADQLSDAALPTGRTVRASVAITSGQIAGTNPAVANAVANGVAQGLSGGGRRG